MARREKDKIYYEVTREKPLGPFHLILVGGASGSVLSFLIVTLIGAYSGMELDSLVLFFLIANFLGFVLGATVVLLVSKYLSPKIKDSFLLGDIENSTSPPQKMEIESPVIPKETIAEEVGEEKGKSIDFVFPELSPDQ